MENKGILLLKYLLVFILAMMVAFAVDSLGAKVFSDLFNWFVSPIVNTTITYWQSFGILLLINVPLVGITTAVAQLKKKDIEEEGISINLAVPFAECMFFLMLWGLGALISLGV